MEELLLKKKGEAFEASGLILRAVDPACLKAPGYAWVLLLHEIKTVLVSWTEMGAEAQLWEPQPRLHPQF